MPVEVAISEKKLIARRPQPMTHNRHKSLQNSFYAIGIKNGNQDMSRGAHTKLINLSVHAHGMRVRVYSQSTNALRLIEGISAEYLLADIGYDSDKSSLQTRSRYSPT